MSHLRIERWLPPLIPFVLVTAILELIVREGWIKSYLMPAPSAIFQAFIDNSGELLAALIKTSAGALAGFTLSAIGGIAIAVALSSSPSIQRAFYPYAVFFQTVPIIAIAPLLV